MSNWERKELLEEAFLEMHGFLPLVEKRIMTDDLYEIRITYKNNVVVLREQLQNGMTKFAQMVHGDKTKDFKQYFQAEKEAVKILEGENAS